MKSNRNYYIASTKFRQILFPTIFMATANNLSLFVDSVITSILCGSDRLAAIQITAPIEAVLSFIIWTIGIGGSLLCFENKAKGKSREGDRFFSGSVMLVLGGSMAMCLICLAFGKEILSFICLDEAIRQLSLQYLKIQAFTFIPTAYVMGLNYFIRADGNPRMPFVVILIANIINLIMDYVYIQIFGLDIRGAALATLTGYLVSAVIVSKYFFSKGRTVKLCLPGKGLFSRLMAIVTCGFPASSIQLYNLLKSMILNRIISGISGGAMIAFSVFNSSMFIPSILYVGIAQTLSPLTSAFYQMGDHLSAKYVVKKALVLGIIATTVLAAIAMIFPEAVMSLFHVNGAAALENTLLALRILPLAYIGWGIVFVLTYYLQAIKELKLATVISFVDGCAISILLAIVLGNIFGIMGVWISVPLATALTIVVYLICALKKGRGLLFIPDAPEGLSYVDYSLDPEISQVVNTAAETIRQINPEIGFMDITAAAKDSSCIVWIKDMEEEYTREELATIPYQTEYCRVCGINCTEIMYTRG